MPKSDVATVLVGVVVIAAGYLMIDESAARNVTDWLRQEIRKDVPDYKSMGHPNYTPVIPNAGR
jgi:hypothetical protein